jgi:hypothetical protein
MDKNTKSETRNKPRRMRLSAWSYLSDDPPLQVGERRLFIGRSQIPFEAERVRVSAGMRVVEVNLGTHRFEPRLCDRREHATGVDFALTSMGRRRIAMAEGKTIEVLVEATEAGPRCVPVLLGQPLEPGVSCVPLSPIERTDLFDLGEGIVDISTEPVQRGRVARVFFRTDGLHEIDLVDLRVGNDSQFVVAADVPLGFFPEGLGVSCELEPWQALSFRVRNRGAPKKLAIDVDMAPPARAQE